MYKNIKWELAGDGKDSVYLVEGALDWLVWELIFGDRDWIYWHAVMLFSFCLRVLAQLIWVLFCHKIQASRKLHFMTEGVFEVWAEEWIVNSLILKTGVLLYIVYIYWNIYLDYHELKKMRTQRLSIPLDPCRPIVGWARLSQAEMH